MMYVQQSLTPGEELIHVGQFHWMYTVEAIMNVLWGLVGCVALIIAAIYVQNFMTDGGLAGYTWIQAVHQLHPGIRLVAFFIFILGLLRFAQMMVYRATTEIAITNSRLVRKHGLVARHVKEISIDRIEGVNVQQTILGRMLNYGRVMVRGMGVGEVVLPPLANPVAFRKAVELARTS